jgi:hypothetical protein
MTDILADTHVIVVVGTSTGGVDALRKLAERWDDRLSGGKASDEERTEELDPTAAVLRTLLSGQVRTPYAPGTQPEFEPETEQEPASEPPA